MVGIRGAVTLWHVSVGECTCVCVCVCVWWVGSVSSTSPW